MMRLTVELVPAGGRARHRVLGVAVIANDGSGSEERGNYTVRLSKLAPHLGETWKTARLVGFPRRGGFGPWELVLAGLFEAIGSARVAEISADLRAHLVEREPGQEG